MTTPSDRLVDNLIDEIVALELADLGALLDAVDGGRHVLTPLQYRRAARRALMLLRKYGRMKRVTVAVRASNALQELAGNLLLERFLRQRPLGALRRYSSSAGSAMP